ADADRMMRVYKHRCRCATTTDLFEDLAVRHLSESVTADFFRCSRTENADSSQSIDHVPRNVRLSIDLGRIQMFIQEFAQLAPRLFDPGLFCRRDPRIRHHPVGHEMSGEQSFNKPERLRPGKEQLLGLL